MRQRSLLCSLESSRAAIWHRYELQGRKRMKREEGDAPSGREAHGESRPASSEQRDFVTHCDSAFLVPSFSLLASWVKPATLRLASCIISLCASMAAASAPSPSSQRLISRKEWTRAKRRRRRWWRAQCETQTDKLRERRRNGKCEKEKERRTTSMRGSLLSLLPFQAHPSLVQPQ